MADAVTVRILKSTPKNYIVRLTNISDGTGETNVKKVDIAALLNANGVKPDGLRIEQIRWSIQGMTYVKIGWDRTAAQITAFVCPAGGGYDDLRGLNKGVQDFTRIKGDVDPSEGNADGKGSILLSTVGAISTGSYDITLWLGLADNTVAT